MFSGNGVWIEHSWGEQVTCLCLPATQYFLNIGMGIVVIATLNMVIVSLHKHFLHQSVCQAWVT